MKVLMLGDAGCGKTSLIQRFVHQEFQLEYAATVGIDLVAMDTKLENGKSAQVQIWDTAGQERFRHLTQNYYRGCHGVVLVYDLTCQESFRHVFSWIKDLKAAADGNFEVVLIANKLDLAPERVVEAERGQLLANEIKAEFFECSALDGSHVDAAFTSLIQKAGSAVAASEVGGHQHAIMTIRPLLHVQTREGSTQYCRNSDSRKRVFSADPIVLHSHFVQTHTTHTHTHTHTHTCTGAHNIIVVTAAAAAAATQSCFHIHA